MDSWGIQHHVTPLTPKAVYTTRILQCWKSGGHCNIKIIFSGIWISIIKVRVIRRSYLYNGNSYTGKGTFTHAPSRSGRKIGFNTLKSSHAFTHTRSQNGGGAGTKPSPQQMGPTSNFPHLLRNRALQTIFVLKKWQIHPRPLRVCVNIPAVAERECQNPPVSAPQSLRAYVNVA